MQQIDMFHRQFRRTFGEIPLSPSTEAHKKIKPTKQTAYDKIRKALSDYPQGLTTEAIAQITETEEYYIQPRITEAYQNGMIEKAGRGKNKRGNAVNIWSLKQ